ncbi:uncharacterized protein K452DRAFT_290474 [Aplosporella prunicola CBS 121167]|uniref:Uncharacterized protein n=1 Tax=Aplosporella prunicola CBS 121167 TaxID=1176127 RepID=A0A6A6B5B8_9PEZI|nr:uncharacterized protein K452DRAFT_290474 [Aplosporella prunicola CBS 121167]KAF2138828.1 hypothetical protein K452DRAFT_290474 [Aplosporella prunicola CBS 121167]
MSLLERAPLFFFILNRPPLSFCCCAEHHDPLVERNSVSSNRLSEVISFEGYKALQLIGTKKFLRDRLRNCCLDRRKPHYFLFPFLLSLSSTPPPLHTTRLPTHSTTWHLQQGRA